jgi:hypothetical protein
MLLVKAVAVSLDTSSKSAARLLLDRLLQEAIELVPAQRP